MPDSIKDNSTTGADSPTTNDLLGYKRFAENIAERIHNLSEKDTPFTYGVYGEWGSGKTSFLKMVDQTLQGRDIYPIWFNAWKYDQEDNLWSALIQTILDQTRISGKWYRRIWVKLKIWLDTYDLRSGSWEIAKGVLSLALRIIIVGLGLVLIFGWSTSEISTFLNQVFGQWFPANSIALNFFQTSAIKTVIALITFFATKPEEWLKLFDVKLGIDFSKLKRSKSYRAHIAFLDEFSEEFKRIIKLTGNGKPLVVVIDDLDRCLPEKAIQVLEAIKLFLDVEGCIFLLAVDRDVVEKAIAVKYKDLLAMAKEGEQSKTTNLFTFLGENYFEKIVQLPFALPPVSDKQFRNFLTNVYSDEQIQHCSEIFFEGLPRNPRKVKRLLQTFLLLLNFASEGIKNGAIQPSLIAKIVIVQSQFRSVYEDLARFRTLLAELEKLYQHPRASSEGTPLDSISNPILREKVEVIATQYPTLRKVLIQKVNDLDTFINIDIEPYLSLTESTVETKPAEEVSTIDTSIPLGEYLRNVINSTQTISLRAIDASAVTSTKPNLANVYIMPSIMALGDKNKSREGVGILGRSVRSVILGSAGSGKSSLLMYLANTFANSYLQGDVSLVKSQLDITENLIPIFISLRIYEMYIKESNSNSITPTGFFEFLDSHFNQSNIGLPAGFFISYFERGTCVLLLDGLDEVSPSVRPLVVQLIINLGRRYPIARIIVTSRQASYTPGLGEDFAHYEIAGFDDEAIKELIEKWSISFLDEPAVAKSTSANLYATILRNNDLYTLAQNPLLLTTMVILNTHYGRLPDNRIDLYENSLDVLLARWDTAKGIVTQNIKLQEIKLLLARLAFLAQDASLDRLDEGFVLSAFSDELLEKGISQSETQSQSISILEAIKERAGLLIEVAPSTYQFVHITFREYLASIILSNSKEFIELVLNRHQNIIWHESIVFSIARVNRTSPKLAESVIQALLATNTNEGILLSGRCLLEIKPIKDLALQKQVIKSLNSLAGNEQVDESMRERIQQVLNKIENDS